MNVVSRNDAVELAIEARNAVIGEELVRSLAKQFRRFGVDRIEVKEPTQGIFYLRDTFVPAMVNTYGFDHLDLIKQLCDELQQMRDSVRLRPKFRRLNRRLEKAGLPLLILDKFGYRREATKALTWLYSDEHLQRVLKEIADAEG